MNHSKIYYSFQIDHIVQGDSGMPIWQYVDDRAVQVGIHSASPHDHDLCQGMGRAIYLPHYIDWIVDTIRNNK